jgi:hypothetical protein
VQYEHFDPLFKDLKTEHRADGITLLCGTHHHMKTSGMLPQENLPYLNANPYSKRVRAVKNQFFIGHPPFTVELGTTQFICDEIIVVDDDVLIGFEPPEDPGGPLRLNARLYDEAGQDLLVINRNEWVAGNDHFDLTASKKELIIKKKRGDILLRIRVVSGRHLSIDRLRMSYKGFKLNAGPQRLQLMNPLGGNMSFESSRVIARRGIMLDSTTGSIGIAGG